MKLHVLTAVTRPNNLAFIAESLTEALSCGIHLVWHLVPDLKSTAVGGQALKNAMLDDITDGWVWICDDDNMAHPDFFATLALLVANNPDAGVFAFAQQLTNGGVRNATAETMRVNHVDAAQVVIRRDVLGERRLDLSYGGDGLLIEALYQDVPERFVFVPGILTYYNRLAYD